MPGLWLTSALSLFLLTACANEKFTDQPQQTQTTASEAVSDNSEPASESSAKDEDASPPATNVEESMPVSETTPMAKPPLFSDCRNTPDRPIVGDLYQLNPDTKALPHFGKLKAIKKICLAQLDIKTRKFSDGFPGVEQLFEWFSLDLRFRVKVPKSGKWEFKLVADDGAILYIDQVKIVDNDGIHGTQEKKGRSQLAAGLHEFRVSYFQGPRYNIALELYWKGPQDSEFSYIPAANLLRPQDMQLFSETP